MLWMEHISETIRRIKRMNREDYIVDEDDADAVKAFETQQDKMDEILTRTYD